MQKFLEEQKKKSKKKKKNWCFEEFLRESYKAENRMLCTHVTKFSNPDSNGLPIIFYGNFTKDGYFRSGNIHLSRKLDSVGDASLTPIHDFLLYAILDDGRTLLEHFEEQTSKLKTSLKEELEREISNQELETLRTNLLKIRKENITFVETDYKVKQIYFPIQNSYHQLSLLTNSLILFELTQRIRNIVTEQASIQFSKQPQNISGFCNKLRPASLLLSYPPTITDRKVKLPKKDFIYQSITEKGFKEEFKFLKNICRDDKNNIEIRERRDNLFIQIIEYISFKAHQIRIYESGWSNRDAYKNLPTYQKIWLDGQNRLQREEGEDWLDQVIEHISRVLIDHYNKYYGKNNIILGDEEYIHVMKLITEHKQVLHGRDNIN
jgi:CRISPR-associated protein Csy1